MDPNAYIINPNADEYTDRFSVLNVFTAGPREEIIPIGLRTLYLLDGESFEENSWEGKTTISSRTIFSKLIDHYYQESAVESCLRDMMDCKYRLIFAGPDDNLLNIDTWALYELPVRLSRSGFGYFRDLLECPTYIQWALLNIAEIRESLQLQGYNKEKLRYLGSRLRAALIGFKMLVRKEQEILKRRFDQIDSNHKLLRIRELQCQNASGDIFFRSLYSFFRTLHAHISRVKLAHNNQLTLEALEIGNEWGEFAADTIIEHASLFGKINNNWEMKLIDSVEDFGERFDQIGDSLKSVRERWKT